MTDSDIARYGRKVINYFFDSVPRNDSFPGSPVYCLGQRYEIPPPPTTETNQEPVIISHSVPSPFDSPTQSSELTSEPEEITKSQLDSDGKPTVQGADQPVPEKDDQGGWPLPFLDDFESRIWMTYRSNFSLIPKSQDPRASSTMSFAVRIRNIANQEGFTSDTGWGCMIRSGQSLLANALILSQYGRGKLHKSRR